MCLTRAWWPGRRSRVGSIDGILSSNGTSPTPRVEQPPKPFQLTNPSSHPRTAQLTALDAKWRTKESRNSAAYRDLLMPAQSRDVGNITHAELYGRLWTGGTKAAIEAYIAATVRGVRTVRKAEARGERLDEKNEWFKARRMVLGRTALFLQGSGGGGLEWGLLGVGRGLFEVRFL